MMIQILFSIQYYTYIAVCQCAPLQPACQNAKMRYVRAYVIRYSILFSDDKVGEKSFSYMNVE